MNMMGWNYATGRRQIERGVVTIYEYERGLLYRNGALQRVLEAGRYRLWAWNRMRIDVVDVRRQSAQIANQKLLTSDQVTVALNMVADYEIADVALSVHRVVNAQAQLYEDVQLAARNIVGAVDVNALLENRVAINTQIAEIVMPLAKAYGLNVLQIGIKDVILSARVRDLLMKEAEAKRVAQAMLIGAREEVAAMRALANAAQLADKNPSLLRLRELDVARTFAGNGGNTLVMGMRDNLPIVRNGSVKTTPNEVTDVEDE